MRVLTFRSQADGNDAVHTLPLIMLGVVILMIIIMGCIVLYLLIRRKRQRNRRKTVISDENIDVPYVELPSGDDKQPRSISALRFSAIKR